MVSVLEGLLAFGSGTVQGIAKRKRENELLELRQREKLQNQRMVRKNQLEKLLLEATRLGIFTPQSAMDVLKSGKIDELTQDEIPGEAGLFEGIEFGGTPQFPVTKPSDINRLIDDVFDRVNKGQMTEKEGSDFIFQQTGRRLTVRRGRQPQQIGGEFTREKLQLGTLNQEIDDLRAEIKQNTDIIQKAPAGEEKEVQAAKQRNRQLRRELKTKQRQRGQVSKKILPRDRVVSEADNFQRLIDQDLLNAETAFDRLEKRIISQIRAKKIKREEGLSILREFRDRNNLGTEQTETGR